jgi:hypothetical protein
VSAPPARLLFALLAFAGAATPANVLVTPPGGQVHGGRLARDPRHPARLVAVYWDERREQRGTCTVARSSDGGATWTSQAFAGAGSGNPLPSGATLCRSPVAAFGPDGALYVAYEAARLEGFAQIELARSTDDGASFGPARVLDPDASGGDRDPSIAAGTRPGRVYVAFQRYSADEERAEVDVVTSDGPSAPVRVSPPEQNAAGSRAALAVDGAGRLYVAWVDGAGVDLEEGGGTARIEVASSPASGQSFGAARAVAEVPSGCGPNDDCGNRYPEVAIAATGRGRVVVAWSSAAFPDPARVSSARSLDGGRSWTAPKAVARAAVADRDQHAPDLSAAPDGRLDLAYLEQARDADNGLLDVYLVHSLDGGKTFSRPLLLDDTPSISDRDYFDAAVSVSSSNASAFATWIDGRRGNAGAATSDVVFAARKDSDAPAAPVVRGALLVRAGRPATYRLSSRDGFTPAAALRFRCALDGAPLRLCSARFMPRLAPGRHVLRAQAVDAAGNRSALTRTVVVVLSRATPKPR